VLGDPANLGAAEPDAVDQHVRLGHGFSSMGGEQAHVTVR
jgi:hypothetical protein